MVCLTFLGLGWVMLLLYDCLLLGCCVLVVFVFVGCFAAEVWFGRFSLCSIFVLRAVRFVVSCFVRV